MNKTFILLFVFLFIGCNANIQKKNHSNIKKSEIELYNIAIEQYSKKNYNEAIKNFNSVKSLYSHSELGEKSILYLISIYIKEKKYTDALILIDELMNNYPGYSENEELNYDYVMTFYKSVEKQLRDKELILKVRNLLTQFLNKFPYSHYSQKIQEEINNINNKLIYREMEIGYFYEIQRNYVAALKRYLIAYDYEFNNNYESELLYRIYYCYSMIGLKDENKKYFELLSKNFKNTNWYQLALILNK
jgi:outer membrane protein assembly factor BamD